MIARYHTLAFTVLLGLAACQQNQSPKGTPSGFSSGTTAAACLPSDADLIERGKSVFNDNGICFTCHGGGGKGAALGPNLTDSIWINTEHDMAKIMAVVRNGVSSPKEHPAPMPPMGGVRLTDEEICAVSAYVYSISK